jgi:hypothetical protein
MGPIVLLDCENIRLAVEIVLLSGLQAKIYVFLYPLPVYGRHLGFLLPLMWYIHIGLIVLLDPENMGVVDGISMLSGLQTELYVFPYPLLVNGRHL